MSRPEMIERMRQLSQQVIMAYTTYVKNELRTKQCTIFLRNFSPYVLKSILFRQAGKGWKCA